MFNKILSKLGFKINLNGVRRHIHSLTLRYLIIFTFCIILPVILLVIGINVVYISSQRNLTQIQMQETLDQMADNIGGEVSRLAILSSALTHNTSFLEYCSNYSSATVPRDLYELRDKIDLELSRLFLYTNKTGLISLSIKNRNDILFKNSPVYSNLSAIPSQGRVILEEIKKNPGRLITNNNFYSILGAQQNRNYINIKPHLSFAIKPNEATEVIDKIVFSYPLEILSNIVNNLSFKRFFYITNSDGHIILEPTGHNLAFEILYKTNTGTLDKDRWIVLSSKIPSTSWNIYQVIDVDEFTKPLYVVQRVFFIIIATLILLFILFTFIFFHNLIKPVNTLIEGMSYVETGDYSIQIDEPKAPEIKRLVQSFNRMVSKIGKLTKDNSRNEKEKSQLELEALQYQINPHFVANTLNSIRLLAVVKKNENIKNMTSSLMQIINDSFRSDGNSNTFRDEINSLKSYVHIMKVRFSIPIDIKFSIPDELKGLKILKMILQPIVENSVVHGFEGKLSRGNILIKTVPNLDSSIDVLVFDNGSGFDNDPFSSEKDAIEKGTVSSLTRVGIGNVDRRIRLNYGEEYGLKIECKRGFYTKVTIKLPRIEG